MATITIKEEGTVSMDRRASMEGRASMEEILKQGKIHFTKIKAAVNKNSQAEGPVLHKTNSTITLQKDKLQRVVHQHHKTMN